MLHRLATILLGTGVVLIVLLIAAAWRLSQGPVELAWLTARLEAAANADGSPTRLSIGGAALAWEGFRYGVDRPIDLRLSDVRLTDPGGQRRVDIPRAEVSLSVLALLRGRVQPRAVLVDNPRLTLRVAEDGTPSLDLGSLAEESEPTTTAQPAGEPLTTLLGTIARPTSDEGAAGWLVQLRRVRVRAAAITVIDRRLGTTWQAPRADLDLRRRPQGGVDGSLDLSLVLGDQQARLTGTASLTANAAETEVTARMTPIVPAALARATASLAALSALDAPLGAEATLRFGPQLELLQATLRLQAGAGTVWLGSGSAPIAGGELALSGTPDAMRIDDARLQLRADAQRPVSNFAASGLVRRDAGRFKAALSLNLDQVAFADLPVLWPDGVAKNARDWIVENITDGTAHDGHIELEMEANADLSSMTLTHITGTLAGNDLTVSWLRPVLPIAEGRALLRVLDPDTLEIAVTEGRQVVKDGKGLVLSNGTVRITGLSQHDQFADIHGAFGGSLPDAISLLREPRLHLFERHPISLIDPAGEATVQLTASLPLEHKTRAEDVAVHVAAHVTGVHLGALVAGRDLNRGTLDIVADNDGMTIKGQATLANIQAGVDAAMDFRSGTPNQVVQRVTLTGRPDARQLAVAGLDATDVLAGPVDLRAVLSEQRNGIGTVSLDADLGAATLTVTPLEWHKPAGIAARVTAKVRLLNDRLEAIDDVQAAGVGLTLQGGATFTNGRVQRLQFDRLQLGRSDVHGSVELPAAPRAGPIVVKLAGPVLDLAPRLTRPRSTVRRTRPEPPGPAWTLDARFDRVLTAANTLVAPVTVTAVNDGSVFQRLHVDGFTGKGADFRLDIAPQNGTRRLNLTAAETGDLLRALDVTDTLQGGRLSVTGSYDDANARHTLHGDAELADFRVSHAAALGKLLQAMTLYGMVDVLKGPGLAFNRLVAPFQLSDDLLELRDARAFSSSLGLTAKGQVDVAAGQANLQGTIVPAYFFNSLLGNVPLIGRLFSPEEGGGLFAANYSLRGRLEDPEVTVNPLSALTPGFLRGVFGIF